MKTGIPVEQAHQIVMAEASPLPSEIVDASAALGRVLAEPVDSGRTLPPADCSAMDGYAVRGEELAGPGPHLLPVVYEVAAGGSGERPLAPGEAARIFTGAPVPPGADTVVRQEDTEEEGDRVGILIEPRRGENVRLAGEDVEAGDTVLARGVRIGAPEIGMLASLGRTLVHVHRRPRVAVVSGGNELVEPDRDASGGRIVSSNAYSLSAQCTLAGAEPTNLGIARDTPEDLERVFRAGLSSDLIVSSAGVSVGDHDHVRPVLEKLGCELRFWGVLMKPGYPLAFGRIGAAGPWVFGLPGNPVSAMVTFEQFVRPMLLRMAGFGACYRPVLEATLAERLTKKPGRLHFVRVHLKREGREWSATSTGTQSSGVLRSMTLAQGLLVFPAEATELAAGARISVQVLDEELFRETEPCV
ncbi:MAG: molybdopterin molybdenumtransferase MoeA [Deltaproteobacteria bacterium]|jgi:molybdopterin molybdotransferase|nr:molybdopterin molybdenumtransferase MoeA [Deltaproteobacteria bacterium]